MLLTSNTHETPKKNSYIVRCIWLFLCGIQWYSPLFRLPQFQPSQKALNKNPQFLHSQHFLVSLWFLQRSECKNRIKKNHIRFRHSAKFDFNLRSTVRDRAGKQNISPAKNRIPHRQRMERVDWWIIFLQ